METIHISAAEASEDFAGPVDRVRRSDEVAIERDGEIVALLRDADAEFKPRRLSESLAMAEALEPERGCPAVMDEDFAADLREIVAMRGSGIRRIALG